MASLSVFATGTTSAVANIPLPPGAVGGDTTGLREIVIDSIFLTVQCTTAVTVGTFRLLRNAADTSPASLFTSALNVPAASSKELILTFPQGLLFPGDPALNADVQATGLTNALSTKLVVTYHYE